MASWIRGLKNSFRRLVAHAESKLFGGAVVETLGTIRGEVQGLGLDCLPTGAVEVHRLEGEGKSGGARVALALEQKVHFGKGNSAVVVSLAESEVRALIGMLRRACPDEGTTPSAPVDRPRTTG